MMRCPCSMHLHATQPITNCPRTRLTADEKCNGPKCAQQACDRDDSPNPNGICYNPADSNASPRCGGKVGCNVNKRCNPEAKGNQDGCEPSEFCADTCCGFVCVKHCNDNNANRKK